MDDRARTRTMTLILDDDDFNAIQREITERQQNRWPEGHEQTGTILPGGPNPLLDDDDPLAAPNESNLAGALLAECVRDLIDYRDLFAAQRGPDGS